VEVIVAYFNVFLQNLPTGSLEANKNNLRCFVFRGRIEIRAPGIKLSSAIPPKGEKLNVLEFCPRLKS
jgi:hypothetical protein